MSAEVGSGGRLEKEDPLMLDGERDDHVCILVKSLLQQWEQSGGKIRYGEKIGKSEIKVSVLGP